MFVGRSRPLSVRGAVSGDVAVCLDDETHPGTGRGGIFLQLECEAVVLKAGWVWRAWALFVDWALRCWVEIRISAMLE